jgi:hypothetical protein
MSHRTARLFAASILVGVILTPSVAAAGGCNISVNPSQGYPGVNVSILGTNFAADNTVYIKFSIHDELVVDKQAPTEASGEFSSSFTVPNGTSPGTGLIVVFDGPGDCEVQRNYQVNPSPPPTTTTTTSSTTTTTTLAPTTTEAPTTTLAATTTVATTTTLATTTSLTEDTTTTTEADSGGGGGVDTIVVVLIVLVVLLALGLAFALWRMRRG